MKYYIYHIEGKKIGCTKRLEQRVREQGYDTYTILETHDDIHTAGIREIELQKQYGYRVDTTTYNEQYIVAGTKGGNIRGVEARDSGQLTLARIRGGEVTKLRHSVPIIAYDKITKELVAEYYSVKEAARQLGLRSCTIHEVLKGRQKSYKGYTFNYKRNTLC
jgi:hypothetical protein